MRKITADMLLPVASEPIKEGVVVIDEEGRILALGKRPDYGPDELEVYKGVIVPGFVNTHCHLELSHMKSRVDTGTGLLPFLQKVVKFRDIPMEEILDAIERADQEMYENGIVAVGDISNKLDTKKQKDKSPIRYYTFVEMFDFLQNEGAQKTFNSYKEVYDGQSDNDGNRKSCVPHAPYTVSPRLFDLIDESPLAAGERFVIKEKFFGREIRDMFGVADAFRCERHEQTTQWIERLAQLSALVFRTLRPR